jgi:hypothetical protein
MAISDICKELKKPENARIDNRLEMQIIDVLLDRLQKDVHNDIQSESVKW